jgi:hypothetical protein
MDIPSLFMIPSAVSSGKVHSVFPNSTDADFDFARSSTATRVNSNGLIESVASGQARLNYEIEGGLVNTKPSLLLEPSSTNIIDFSEDYSQSAWLKTNLSITSNSIKSPSGVVDSAKLIPDTTNGQHKIDITKTVSNGATVALSAFVKKGEYEFVCLYEVNSAKGRFYNLNDGTQGGTFGGAPTTSNIEQLPNDWYRISITTTVPSTSARFIVYVCDSISNTAFVGDNTKGLYVWGAMLEEQSYATSYIPTNGSTQTRAAETCNGAGTSSIFESSEGILYAEIASLTSDVSVDNRIVLAKSGDTNNAVRLSYNTTSNTIQFKVRVATVNACNLTYDLGDSTAFHKICGKWKQNDFALWVDGVEVATDTTGAIFPADTLNTVNFSNANASGDEFYGKVRDIRVYNTKEMTDSEVDILLTKITS